MPHFVSIETNGVRLRAAIEGAGPLVVLVHGFPESWYSWRHQMAPLAAAGFTACAIDVLGYGGSDKPFPVERYSMEALTSDVAGVIAALSPNEKAVVIGHDWGAPIAWNTALLHPDRVRAVAGLSVPYVPQGETPFIDMAHEIFTKRGLFFYQVYFQEEGVAEREWEADVRGGLRRFYYAISGDAPDGTWPLDKKHGDTLMYRLPDPDPFPAWLSAADLDYYVSEFTRSGFRGPINRYRNHRRDHAFLRALADQRIHQPALFIGGERDLVLKMFPGVDLFPMMKAAVPNLRAAHLLPGIGHWTQQEAPDAVTGHLIDWLATL